MGSEGTDWAMNIYHVYWHNTNICPGLAGSLGAIWLVEVRVPATIINAYYFLFVLESVQFRMKNHDRYTLIEYRVGFMHPLNSASIADFNSDQLGK